MRDVEWIIMLEDRGNNRTMIFISLSGMYCVQSRNVKRM